MPITCMGLFASASQQAELRLAHGCWCSAARRSRGTCWGHGVTWWLVFWWGDRVRGKRVRLPSEVMVEGFGAYDAEKSDWGEHGEAV